MINIIWVALFLIGMGYAALNGTMDAVNKTLFVSAKDAVEICFGLISVLIFWLGLMKIAEQAGLLGKLSGLMRPIMRKIFPEVPPDHPAMGYILSNTIANIFGLGNAATPMGIKAMKELKRLNGGKKTPSRSMITLLALNTSGLTLIPTTVIAIRMQYGSQSPTDIVAPTLIATCCTTVAALIIDRYFYYRRKRRGKK
ncbi:spore maturation protein [Sporolactobacillus sp. CPB3-1]|uniref:Spore maturation protein n=1 Tax=Sporolactobacillus mangiferae TaxID=2940498 RepID=A0ABT0MAG2_9BACL|nr:nucleoside recognition domain-containing protein [Sporolactobacillus mangiferae]MCL1631861.1 spore maturation protein [Sporolactobacillus mangiferae]